MFRQGFPLIYTHPAVRSPLILSNPSILGGMLDFFIVGGGIVGNAMAYALSFSNMAGMLVEKYKDVALVNSNTDQNAQSLHGGPEEATFGFEKVMMMRVCEMLIGAFLEKFGGDAFMHLPKMAFGVGDHEVDLLTGRFDTFKPYFPTLELLNRAEIYERHPLLIEGRDLGQKVTALYRQNGWAVDYHKLALRFKEQTLGRTKQIEFKFETKVEEVIKHSDHYEIVTNKGTFRSRVLLVAAGHYSLKYAKDMDAADLEGQSAKEFITLPMAGDFWRSPRFFDCKVYPIQNPRFPYAMPHADSAIHDRNILRWGPTTKWIPFGERYHWITMIDYIRSGILTSSGMASSLNLFLDWEKHSPWPWPDDEMIGFYLKNMSYKLPFVGTKNFAEGPARHIMPTIKASDLEFIPGAGGLRPQPLNKKTGKLQMGTGKFFSQHAIYDLTPSPGASSSLRNGILNAKYALAWRGNGYHFNEMGLYEEIGMPEYPVIDINRAVGI